MWKAMAALAVLVATQAPAQTPGGADLEPYIAALGAAGAYLPGAARKSLHLANYDDASHRALVREAFTASVLGGAIAPAAQLAASGSLIPTGARWLEKRYVFGADNQCEVFINVREVGSAIGTVVPRHAAFSVWHELAHCTMLELADASVDGGQRAFARDMVAKFEAALPGGRGRLAYTLVNEAFADSFALLVEASVRGPAAARDTGEALLRYRRQEHAAQDGEAGAGAHDTRFALGLLLATLGAYDLSELGARDRCVLAMNFATDGALRWVEAEAGAEAASTLRPVLGEFERLLQRSAAAAPARPAAGDIPVFLAYPGDGRQSRLRIM